MRRADRLFQLVQLIRGRRLSTARFLAEGWMIYLYHPQYLIAHTTRLENFKPMPDGLIRVIDVKLK